MEEKTINVKIADKSYKLKVDPEEEDIIIQIANDINSKIADYMKNYKIMDKQDLLAMATLHIIINLYKEKKLSNDNFIDYNKLSEIENTIDLLSKSFE